MVTLFGSILKPGIGEKDKGYKDKKKKAVRLVEDKPGGPKTSLINI